jgi:hypothetical protein
MISELLELEQENAELKAENFRLCQQLGSYAARLADYVGVVDRMKLDLITSGALTDPKKEGVCQTGSTQQ